MKKYALLPLLLLGLSLQFSTTLISQKLSQEKKIESIMQLAKFIDWSGNSQFSDSKRIIYVLTEAKSSKNYEIKGKNDQKYKNWQIICMDKIKDIESGSVVFITNEQLKQAIEVIELSTRKDILTISENADKFCIKGGMINMVEYDEKFRFEINYRIIQNKSLNISSKILALAKIYD